MASNAELVEQIKEIEPSFEQGDMTNKELSAKLKELNAETKSAPKASVAVYTVPKGKAMTTKAGMKAEGEVITVDMISGGEESFNELIVKGLLVK
jgi:hypothetical protein